MEEGIDIRPILSRLARVRASVGNARGLLLEARSSDELRRVATELERMAAYAREARDAFDAMIDEKA
jgi:hypothetical protein